MFLNNKKELIIKNPEKTENELVKIRVDLASKKELIILTKLEGFLNIK